MFSENKKMKKILNFLSFVVCCALLLFNGNEKESRDCADQNRIETKLIADGASQIEFLKYDYYSYDADFRHYCLADVFEPNKIDQKTVEVRLIENADELDGVPLEYLQGEKSSFLEVASINESILNLDYYLLNDETVNLIKNKTKKDINQDDIRKRLMTSFNYHFNYACFETQYKLNKSIKKVRNFTGKSRVDEQAPLDYYLDTIYIKNGSPIYSSDMNMPQIIAYYNESQIASLLDHSIFSTPGTYMDSGTEWGYYARTSNSLETQVLIYDIEQVRANDDTPDMINVKVVEHRNYKYYSSCDAVIPTGTNNLCIGNPILESDVRYISNGEADCPPNPGDSNYSQKDDYGFCFGSLYEQHIGVGKNSDRTAEVANGFLNFSATTLASFLLPGISTLASVALGTSISFLEESIFDLCYPDVYKLESIKSGDKYQYEWKNLNNMTNYKTMREKGQLSKHTMFRMPPYGSTKKTNEDFVNNIQTPLLFKDSSDSINYRHDVVSSETHENYTAVISHKLSLDIFDDDSVWLFKWDPKYITTTTSAWAYLIGKDVKSSPVTVTAAKDSYNLVYGTKEKQDIIFVPKTSSAYDLVLANASEGSTIVIEEIPDAKPQEFKKQAANIFDEKEIYHQISYKSCVWMTAGKTYHIHVYRDVDGIQGYGSGLFSIYEAKSGFGVLQNYPDDNDISATYSRIKQTINYNGFRQTHQLYSNKEEVITISLLNSDKKVDTYLDILDDMYRPIMSNDDGFGNLSAGIIIRMKAYKPIYIVPRLYSRLVTDSFELNVTDCKWLPKANPKSNSILITMGYHEYKYHLISFSKGGTLKLRNHAACLLISIYDLNGNEIPYYNMLVTKDVVYLLRITNNLNGLGGAAPEINLYLEVE